MFHFVQLYYHTSIKAALYIRYSPSTKYLQDSYHISSMLKTLAIKNNGRKIIHTVFWRRTCVVYANRERNDLRLANANCFCLSSTCCLTHANDVTTTPTSALPVLNLTSVSTEQITVLLYTFIYTLFQLSLKKQLNGMQHSYVCFY